ncbi:MAG: DUF362 domain-containing protein [Chloroflexi bacterium]|nr:DUF362 domain-containing protein [Chloroflexota bacterium]
MNHLSRREFLRRIATGLGGAAGTWFLNACGVENTPPPDPTLPATHLTTSAADEASPTPIPPTATASGVPTTASSSSTPNPTPTPAQADLVVARGGEPEDLVRRAVAALGGIEQFVHQGDEVIVKPNICVAYHTYEYAATTNPWVVAAVVRMCLEAGAAHVKVMDYPFGGTAEEAYNISGIREQVEAAGGSMEFMPGYKYVKMDIPQGKSLKSTKIYGDILQANVLINVPIAKHHNLAKLTIGMKNLLGVIADRTAMHQNIGQRLADLASRILPTLTIVDAVRILTANGPTGGNLDDVKKLDTVIASRDLIAADAYASTLFGMQPTDLAYVVAGSEMGLGNSDLNSLKIAEV